MPIKGVCVKSNNWPPQTPSLGHKTVVYNARDRLIRIVSHQQVKRRHPLHETDDSSSPSFGVVRRRCSSLEFANALGKAFAPERVLFVSALPKTRSAKIVRRAVRATALGEDPGDLSTLENPETLEEIANAV